MFQDLGGGDLLYLEGITSEDNSLKDDLKRVALVEITGSAEVSIDDITVSKHKHVARWVGVVVVERREVVVRSVSDLLHVLRLRVALSKRGRSLQRNGCYICLPPSIERR